LISTLIVSCTGSETVYQQTMPELTTSDLAKYKMKILPEIPTSGDDVKLIIYEDCKYNKLVKVQKSGNFIDIEKQYNSMIMAPCMITNDTILIGKLPIGTYGVNYRLVDIARQPDVKTNFYVAFKLSISK
jgi:hypothetical protein